MIEVLINFSVTLLIVLLVTYLFFRLRNKLLKMWKEVSVKEVVFHKLLLQTLVLFYGEKNNLKNEDNKELFRKLARYRKKKVRYLLLQERRELFTALNYLYLEISELDAPSLLPLKAKFEELQRARRIYNSKVLTYNQTINVFPTRFLAIRMNLKIKEYFG